MQRNARTDPALVFIEIDTHHFALTHANEIVRENRFMEISLLADFDVEYVNFDHAAKVFL